jgi:imidazole glycerol-phosphate synthase subunit HisH
VDYGMGNLRSVSKAFENLGYPATITRDPQILMDATHIVLPGVGAFPDGMKNLNRFGLSEPIRQTIAAGKPFLGICLGLQLLFTESEEFGLHQGLGIIPGRVNRFQSSGWNTFKIPHMGWNTIKIVQKTPVLDHIEDESPVYFVHSYFVVPVDDRVVSTKTFYGLSFASSIIKNNIFACQFHPEKSQAVGLRILKNFSQWKP